MNYIYRIKYIRRDALKNTSTIETIRIDAEDIMVALDHFSTTFESHKCIISIKKFDINMRIESLEEK